MLLDIIDRRGTKNKSIGNRERFLHRNREVIKEAVRRKLDASGKSISDPYGDGEISIPKRSMDEPVFGHGSGGKRETVHPGNKDFIKGDKIERPKGGQGGGGGNGQGDGGGDDDFVFTLTKEEFMQIFFEDMGLPNLLRNQVDPDATEFKTHRAGYTTSGSPNNLHVVRTMRDALARRIAFGAGPLRVKELETKRETLRDEFNWRVFRLTPETVETVREENKQLLAELEDIEAKLKKAGKVPYLDPLDLVFRNLVHTPKPSAKAVMFCLMDVSGSMDEERKELAKRFFILEHLFLEKVYGKVEVVFIRFHDKAEECDEKDFFYKKETGGTNVENALVLMEEIRKARYAGEQWNVFGSLASDGDAYAGDANKSALLLNNEIMPIARHFAYLQVVKKDDYLWEELKSVKEQFPDNFGMAQTDTKFGIIEALRHFYKKTKDAVSNFAAQAAPQP